MSFLAERYLWPTLQKVIMPVQLLYATTERYFWPIVRKKFIMARREWRFLVFGLAFPILAAIAIWAFSYIPVGGNNSVKNVKPLILNPSGNFTIPYEVSPAVNASVSDFINANLLSQNSSALLSDDASFFEIPFNSTDEFLLADTTVANHTGPWIKYYTSLIFNSLDLTNGVFDITVGYNDTDYNGVLPAMINIVGNAIYRSLGGAEVLQNNEQDLASGLKKLSVPFFFYGPLLVQYGFTFVVALFGIQMVREREIKWKQQMHMSSMRVPMYWLAHFVGDLLLYLITASIALTILIATTPEPFRHNNIMAPILTFFFYGTAAISMSYPVSLLFPNQEIATRWFYPTLGLLTIIPYIVLQVILKNTNTPTFVFNLLSMIPSYGLYHSVYVQAFASFEGNPLSFSDIFTPSKNLLAPLLILLCETIFFLTLVIVIDSGVLKQLFGSRRRGVVELRRIDPSREPISPSTAGGGSVQMDEAVLAERQRVFTKGISSGVSEIDIVDIMKTFVNPNGSLKRAVGGVTLSIPPDECFGLLGPNGAGKTTLLSILCGQEQADSGDAYIAGHSVSTQLQQVYRAIGVCPQHDALEELLTGREHLELYARVKGVPSNDIDYACSQLLLEFKLVEDADKFAKDYSGGMKRKLSTAIAFLGNPNIVFLDEPSTGMDPVARRQLWDIIQVMKRGRALVLTTHSMDEADALCARIGIMVSGQLRCLGSSQYLKNRFGNGYRLSVKTALETEDAAHNAIMSRLRGAQFMNELAGCRNYQIPQDNATLASIFGVMEELTRDPALQIADYSVSQTTLEQVFLRFAAQQELEDDISKRAASL